MELINNTGNKITYLYILIIPQLFLNKISISVIERLSANSSCIKIFKNNKKDYELALSGYHKNWNTKWKIQRIKGNIICFNPPHDKKAKNKNRENIF